MCYQTRDYSPSHLSKFVNLGVDHWSGPPRPSTPFVKAAHWSGARDKFLWKVLLTPIRCQIWGMEWRGEGTWTAIEADCGGFPDCRNTAAPPVGFPRLVQYSPVMAPIPVYRGQGQCQAEGPHILLCTAHIIQPPPTQFRIGLQGSVIAITVKAVGSGRAIWWNISLGERSFRVDNHQWDLLSGWLSSWGMIINRVLTPVPLL